MFKNGKQILTFGIPIHDCLRGKLVASSANGKYSESEMRARKIN